MAQASFPCRTAGRYEHGVRPQDQKSGESHQTSVRQVRQAVDRCRSDSFVLVSAYRGYPLRSTGRCRRCAHDRICAHVFRAVGVSICMLGTGLNRRAPVLRHRLSARGNRANSHQLGAAVNGSTGADSWCFSVAVLAILITAPLGAIGIDRTAGRASRAGEPVRYCRMRICWVRL